MRKASGELRVLLEECTHGCFVSLNAVSKGEVDEVWRPPGLIRKDLELTRWQSTDRRTATLDARDMPEPGQGRKRKDFTFLG